MVEYAVPRDHRVNLKESSKSDKYLDLISELKKKTNPRTVEEYVI